jgi:hypothetical protein
MNYSDGTTIMATLAFMLGTMLIGTLAAFWREAGR